jgi:hypothetical protein
MLGLLNRHEFAEFGGFRNLSLSNGLGVRFEDTEHFVCDVRIAAQESAPAGLLQDSLNGGPHLLQLMTRASQARRRRGRV